MVLAKPISEYETSQTWLRGLEEQWGEKPDNVAGRLEALQRFCEFVERDPDAIIAECTREVEGGKRIRIKSRRLYEKGPTELPDWRITCFFTGKGQRRRGVADAALGGALAEIAGHGGGTVEGYPEETDDRTVSGSFLHTGPMAAFENHGFTRSRPISPHRWVVTRSVEPT